jgi:hypothetical protein
VFAYLKEERLEVVGCIDNAQYEEAGQVGGQQLVHNSSFQNNDSIDS